jgi:hypothetical protein
MATVNERIIGFMPGYCQIHGGDQKRCIDSVTSHESLDACREVFEQIYKGDCLKEIGSRDQKFLKENALKALELIWVWQGRPPSPKCKFWGAYIGFLIVILCASLGTLKAYMFGLLSHFYYLTVLFMVWSHTASCYATPTALMRLRRDFALTLEFPALGYAIAALVPSLYQKPWYSIIIIGLTILHLIWNRFRPVIMQDRFSNAHKKRRKSVDERVSTNKWPDPTADQQGSTSKWLRYLDVIEAPIGDMKEALELQGSSRHNTQVTLFCEGWNNVIICLYQLVPDYLLRDRMLRSSSGKDNQNGSNWTVKLVLTSLYFPVGVLRAPPLYQAGEYGAFAQACIAVIDVGVILCYRTRSQSYAIPAFTDHYSAVMIFAAAGLPPIWLLWSNADRFSENIYLFFGFYLYMFVATFILGPASINCFSAHIKTRFANDQSVANPIGVKPKHVSHTKVTGPTKIRVKRMLPPEVYV